MKFREERGIFLEHTAQARFQIYALCLDSDWVSDQERHLIINNLKTKTALYSAAYMANSRIFKIVLRWKQFNITVIYRR